MSGWRNSAPSVFFTGWDFSVLTTKNLVKYLLLQYEIVSLLCQFLSLHFQCQKTLLFLFSTFWCSAPLPLQDESLACRQSFDKLNVAKYSVTECFFTLLPVNLICMYVIHPCGYFPTQINKVDAQNLQDFIGPVGHNM